MSVKKILETSIDIVLDNLYRAQSIYGTPIDYLEYIETRKYENPKFTDKDWEIVRKEKDSLRIIRHITSEAIEIAERLKKNG